MTSVSLPVAPTVLYQQNGVDSAVDVPLVYDAGLQAFVGTITLDPDLHPSGTLAGSG
jgi:hypothetical protein